MDGGDKTSGRQFILLYVSRIIGCQQSPIGSSTAKRSKVKYSKADGWHPLSMPTTAEVGKSEAFTYPSFTNWERVACFSQRTQIVFDPSTAATSLSKPRTR